ncbi:UNVERIFIED_CONTAM: hypothetical protein HDU68_007854 [Siphonaria sp. JEL0065]|nr:hypothetical protein HDU68_007854 [Siphonaria sp. JEL0065]
MITLNLTTTEYYAALIGASGFVSLLVILNIVFVVALVRQRTANYAKDTDSLTESDKSSSTSTEKAPYNSPFNPNYKFPPTTTPEQKISRVFSMRESVPVLPAPPFIQIPRTATTTSLRFGRPSSPMIALPSTGLRSPTPSSAAAINTMSANSPINTNNYRRPSIANSLPPRPDSASISTTRTRKASDSFSRHHCNVTPAPPPPQGHNNLRRPSDAPSSSTISTSGFLQLKPTRLSAIEQQQKNEILSLQQHQQIAQANYIMRSRSVTRSPQQNSAVPLVASSLMAVVGAQPSSNKRPTSVATEIMPFSPQSGVGTIIAQLPVQQKQGRVSYAPAALHGVAGNHLSLYGRRQYDYEMEQADSQSVIADEEEYENQFMRGRERHLSVYTVDSHVSTL